MRIDVLTLFPSMFNGPLTESLLGKARSRGLIDIRIHSLRQWSDDRRHAKVDDRPFGGGAGMVIRPEPVYRALKSFGRMNRTRSNRPWVVYLTPKGERLTQSVAQDLTKRKHLVLLCGHYEGIDERVMEWVDQDVSIGDVVLTGGEIPALAVIDAVARLVPGVVGDPVSVQDESFSNGLLEYPHYTRPAVWKGRKAPAVLLSGHHKNISDWRKDEAVALTRKRRPDMLKRISGVRYEQAGNFKLRRKKVSKKRSR